MFTFSIWEMIKKMIHCFIFGMMGWGLVFGFHSSIYAQSLTTTINHYLQQHDPPLQYNAKKDGWWEFYFEGNESSKEIVLWIQVSADSAGNQFVGFWSTVARIPPEVIQDPQRAKLLYQTLLEIGRDYYIIKAVVDRDHDIGIQAEIHADDLTPHQFFTTLWMVVDRSDKEYNRLKPLLE